MESVEVKKDIYWVGAVDSNLKVFDIIMYTPFGTTYNSYVIKGSKKTAVFETVKEQFFDDYLKKLKSLNIELEKIDYIIVDHTEPDHAGSVAKLLDIAKNAKVVGSNAAIKFLSGIVNRDFESIIVKDGDTLSLGNKTLKFISAPLLHWPDSIFTYVEEDNVLFTCDAFGSHYSNKVFNDSLNDNKDYLTSLKYYFDNIMGPFKPSILKAINKIKDLKIDVICPGHGPILRDEPLKVVELYKKWSTPEASDPNRKDVVICYVSAYGYTKSIADKIASGIRQAGNINVKLYDAAVEKEEDILSDISNCDGVLFGSPTINGDALKPIWNILTSLSPIHHKKILSAAFGSFGWSGEAVPNIEGRLKQLRYNIFAPGLKINFKPSDSELENAFEFGKNFAEQLCSK